MQSSSITSKGQITIPSDIRQKLGLHAGDKVGFVLEDDHIVLVKKEQNIEAAFGISKPGTSASLSDIDHAIKKRGGDAVG
jgi:AbrB family looped-hinge helix DNA binding protein